MTIFGERLIELRKEQGLSQYAIAGKLGIPRSSLSGYETEGKEPSYELLRKIASMLNVSTDYLVGASNERRSKEQSIVLREMAGLREDIDVASPNMRDKVALILGSVYKLIRNDVRDGNTDQVGVYSELFETIRKGKEVILDSREMDNAVLLRSQADMMASVNAALMKVFIANTKED